MRNLPGAKGIRQHAWREPGEGEDMAAGRQAARADDWSIFGGTDVKRTMVSACLLGAVLVGCIPGALCLGSSETAIEISISVSPKTIVLGLDKGDRVTVHTDIPLALVDRESLTLSGVSPVLVKADNRGNLVAKFAQASIEALVAPPEATLALTGTTTGEVPFRGSDTVRVIEDPSPEG
jgi:hypothetical protein